jgi:hypothetical protein
MLSSAHLINVDTLAVHRSVARFLRMELPKLAPPEYIKGRFIKTLEEKKDRALQEVQTCMKEREARAEFFKSVTQVTLLAVKAAL